MLRDLEPLTRRVKHIDLRREQETRKQLLGKELKSIRNNQIQRVDSISSHFDFMKKFCSFFFSF